MSEEWKTMFERQLTQSEILSDQLSAWKKLGRDMALELKSSLHEGQKHKNVERQRLLTRFELLESGHG